MIEVENLKFKYPGDSTLAVNDINFNIKTGEIFGFLGPSGAGKSTTQKILIKILEATSGQVRIMDKSISEWNNEFYEHIGVDFELPNHYSKLTAWENLQFFSSFYRSRIKNTKDLLERVGLANDINKKTESYSKGMKMRLNFVRALMHDPKILFLDEPTSGLDPVNAHIMKEIILEQKKAGKTIFLTTHNMHDADELCDRVAFIVDGKLKLTDSPDNLKQKFGKRKVIIEYGKNSNSSAEFDMNKLGTDKNFIHLLQNEFISTIHSQETTLDNIFIRTTGKNL